MLRHQSVHLFHTSVIEAQLFGMADDVYGTIEIFKNAVKFEAKVARRFEMMTSILDCVVFMVVAVMVIAFTMHSRLVMFRKLAQQSRLHSQRMSEEKRALRRHTRLAFNTSLHLGSTQSTDELASKEEDERKAVDDEDAQTLRPVPSETEKLSNVQDPTGWAVSWLNYVKIEGFGSFFDPLSR